MGTHAASANCAGPFVSTEVASAARSLLAARGEVSRAAFVFATSDYVPHIEELCDILRVEGRITEIAGCTGVGLVAQSKELEHGSGFSVLSLSSPDTSFHFCEATGEMLGASDGGRFWKRQSGVQESAGWVAMFNPLVFPADTWLSEWNAAFPSTPCIGGLASGNGGENSVAVFWNGRVIEGGVLVGFSGGSLRLTPVVSQGCRPIGEPLTVTRAENNVIYALGAHPAYEALETAFQTLSDTEKSTARGNLFAGLATSEYVEDFLPGDFLIRNIIGADPNSGAVVIGGIPRVGQTLQYQYRDRQAASSDLTHSLETSLRRAGTPVASLLFSCAGRGNRLFGAPHHDASRVQDILGPHPSAGLLCNGEIGPVHSINCLTAYTASIALFHDAPP